MVMVADDGCGRQAGHKHAVLVEFARLLGPEFAQHHEWRARAACRGMDPSLWFPRRGQDLGALRTTCRVCPVRPECLQFALDGGAPSYAGGIWAGSSPPQRREIRRRGWSVDRALEWLDARGW
jgi:WhiB family transcriptional regulator, redox-sensing transcriptional regulator